MVGQKTQNLGESRSQAYLNGWHVIFGDLLMLLICFVVAVISHQSFPEAERSLGKNLRHTKKSGNSAILASSASSVHGSALELYEGVLSTFHFSETDIGGGDFSPTALRKLEDAVSSQKMRGITIEACGIGATAWTDSLERVLDIRSVLRTFETRKKIHLVLEFLGPYCQRIAPGDKSAIVARVIVHQGIRSHG